MFSLGTAEARAEGLRDAARLAGGLPGAPIDPSAVDRALATVADAIAAGTAVTRADLLPENGATAALRLIPSGDTPAALMRLGADAHRLRSALAAEGLSSEALPQPDGLLIAISGRW
jgi:coenzyme F420-0:L-glutamate ligase/coenzyme F420-1:gamma-L-glutamate ligase